MIPRFRHLALAGLVAIGPAMAEDPAPPRKPTITPAARGERLADKLAVGEAAPNFTLPAAAGGKDVSLADWKGKRPVVLVFASCT